MPPGESRKLKTSKVPLSRRVLPTGRISGRKEACELHQIHSFTSSLADPNSIRSDGVLASPDPLVDVPWPWMERRPSAGPSENPGWIVRERQSRPLRDWPAFKKSQKRTEICQQKSDRPQSLRRSAPSIKGTRFIWKK